MEDDQRKKKKQMLSNLPDDSANSGDGAAAEIPANSTTSNIGDISSNNNNNVNMYYTMNMTDEEYLARLPCGYRFCPTDEEIVVEYLEKKLMNQPLPPNPIKVVDFYDCRPDQLWKDYRKKEEEVIYFFSSRERKYPKGSRPNRTANGGFWKASGRGKEVTSNGRVVGCKTSLVFYQGNQKAGSKTQWLMNEYTYAASNATSVNGSNGMMLDRWVMCRLYTTDKGEKNQDHVATDTNDKGEKNLEPQDHVVGHIDDGVPNLEQRDQSSLPPNGSNQEPQENVTDVQFDGVSYLGQWDQSSLPQGYNQEPQENVAEQFDGVSNLGQLDHHILPHDGSNQQLQENVVEYAYECDGFPNWPMDQLPPLLEPQENVNQYDGISNSECGYDLSAQVWECPQIYSTPQPSLPSNHGILDLPHLSNSDFSNPVEPQPVSLPNNHSISDLLHLSNSDFSHLDQVEPQPAFHLSNSSNSDFSHLDQVEPQPAFHLSNSDFSDFSHQLEPQPALLSCQPSVHTENPQP